MHFYVERKTNDAINKDSAINFDNIISCSEKTTTILGTSELNEEFSNLKHNDFNLIEGCYIDILTAGSFMIEWAVRTITGFSVDGPWFELKYYDPKGNNWHSFNNDFYEDYKKGPASIGSIPFEITLNNISASTPSGNSFRIEDYGSGMTEETLSEPLGDCFRIALFNVSNRSHLLSKTNDVKASLIIYGIPAFTNLIKGILKEFEEEKARCCIIDILPKISELELLETKQYHDLCCLSDFRDVFVSEFDDHFTPYIYEPFPCYNWGSQYGVATTGNPPQLVNDLRVNVTKIGTFYLFTLHGRLISPKPNAGLHYTTTTPSNAYFLRSTPYQSGSDPINSSFPFDERRIFEPLTRIPSTISKLVYPIITDTRSNSSGSLGTAVVYLDNTGLYMEFAGPHDNSTGVGGADWGFSIGVIIPDIAEIPI